MHIGILQTGHVADALIGDHGDYDEIFRTFLAGHGFGFSNYAVVDGAFPEGPESCDAWLITGSKHGTYEALPWIAPLEALIRAIHGAGLPMVGICFGHQIVAQALGGKVEKFAGGWAAGRKVYEFDGLGPVALNAWHQDQVTGLPPGARVVARNDFCANAALAYGEQVLTIQAHPEILNPYLQGLLDVRAPGVVPRAEIDAARSAIGLPLDDRRIADHFASFFRAAAARRGRAEAAHA